MAGAYFEYSRNQTHFQGLQLKDGWPQTHWRCLLAPQAEVYLTIWPVLHIFSQARQCTQDCVAILLSVVLAPLPSFRDEQPLSETAHHHQLPVGHPKSFSVFETGL